MNLFKGCERSTVPGIEQALNIHLLNSLSVFTFKHAKNILSNIHIIAEKITQPSSLKLSPHTEMLTIH